MGNSNNDVWIAIIGVAGTIIGVVLGFLLQYPYNYFREKKNIKSEFTFLVDDLINAFLANYLNIKLFKLRHFFIQHIALLKKEINDVFFHKWLNSTSIIEIEYKESQSSGNWTVELINDLKDDLMNLKKGNKLK